MGLWARQVGKTFSTSLEVVDSCFEAECQGRKERWVILSRGERQAKEAMEEGVKPHAKAYSLSFESFDYEWEGETNYKALEVVLPKGSRITALPSNPDTARGFSANVFLDEFAFHADSRKIWAALFPVISAGHKIRVVSTPNGKGNKFFELATGNDNIWSRHRVDIYKAVADGLPRDIEQLRAALNDEDAWAQEYELKWLDEASAWLPYDLINACEHDHAGISHNYQGELCFVGVDIGLRRDLWCAWVWEKVGDVFWCREIRTLKRASFAEQDAVLDELVKPPSPYRVARICIDQTGMGEKVVEDAKRRYGQHRVEGVLFTPANKLLLATIGKQNFEDRKVRIPMGDTELRADLHKLQKIPTATGGVRFDATADSNGHADRTWAAFLGLYAGSQLVTPIDFRGLGNLRVSTGINDFLRVC
ncbi:MAG: terminase [Okeania sp. SIO2D1]|nr:terminase [Okeania sp. SIO2D1]